MRGTYLYVVSVDENIPSRQTHKQIDTADEKQMKMILCKDIRLRLSLLRQMQQ